MPFVGSCAGSGAARGLPHVDCEVEGDGPRDDGRRRPVGLRERNRPIEAVEVVHHVQALVVGYARGIATAEQFSQPGDTRRKG